ncbi:MAG: FecR domain-containing protein [Spirochaetales bacterium]|nr:FecR domain-containing protein [Spirochaetales bacterium]
MRIYIYLFIITALVLPWSSCRGKQDTTAPLAGGDRKEELPDTTTPGDEEKAIPAAGEDESEITAEKSSTSDRATTSNGISKKASSVQDDSSKETITRKEPGEGEEGEITYLEGNVGITRNAVSLDASRIDTGTRIMNYDLVSTKENSMVEIEVISARCPATIITVEENTAFTFDINRIDGTETTQLDMFAGSIALKVDALAKSQDLLVNTGETAMGVRGTAFTVTTLPTGEVLVTCKQGRVECKDTSGKRLYAQPGKVVEAGSEAAVQEVNVPVADVETYRDDWYTKKVTLLKGNALLQIKKLAAEYEKRLSQFTEAYRALFAESDIIDKWIQEDKKGATGTNMEVMKEKKTIIGHLYAIQKSLFWFQRIYFRLIELKRFHDLGFGKGNIREGLSTDTFFNNLLKQNIEKKLADIRYIYKLYALRNNGSVPIGSVSDDFTDDDDFFDDGDFFDDDDF